MESNTAEPLNENWLELMKYLIPHLSIDAMLQAGKGELGNELVAQHLISHTRVLSEKYDLRLKSQFQQAPQSGVEFKKFTLYDDHTPVVTSCNTVLNEQPTPPQVDVNKVVEVIDNIESDLHQTVFDSRDGDLISSYNSGVTDTVKKCISEIEALPVTSGGDGWIRVETPPIESNRYWCYVKELGDLGWSYYQWNCYYDKQDNEWRDNMKKVYVTHWQPLPTPPTTNNNE